jgi:DNA (cytosine-5)-methyltransferase 1
MPQPMDSGVNPRRPKVPHYRGPYLSLPPAEGAPDGNCPQSAREWVKSISGLTAIDLFCGAGGLSLGLKDAGFTVLVGADVDPVFVETHTANLGGLGYVGDLVDPTHFLRTLRAWGIRHVDLVAGGVPCQPFSRAGRSKIRSLVEARQRPARDSRAELWQSFVHIVAHLKPRAVLLENVPDLAVWQDGEVLSGFCESLRDLGYLPQPAILHAYEHGVPQHRNRLFIVGLRNGLSFPWPRAEQPSPTVWDAIGDLPPVPPAQREDRLRYSGPVTDLQRRMRREVSGAEAMVIYDHLTRDLRADDAEAFRLLPQGGTYEQLPKRLQRYRSDIFSDKYKRLEWGGLSRSITAHIAKDGYWYIHPVQDRTLSVREAARIQTFPDWFRFAGQPTLRFRQIGNAVPPLLAEALGRSMTKVIHKRPRQQGHQDHGQFGEMLHEWHAESRRDYPWRAEVGPWRVLLAEMCLRRTKADQVVSVYEALVELAATPSDLLEHEPEVLQVMQSLGLHWRADNMIPLARTLVDLYGGEVPRKETELRSLPGVGAYVASAVISFGFGRRAAIIDTNTDRIASRVMGRERSTRWQVRLDMYHMAGSEGPTPSFNYALLDLGALICRASKPRCESCPVSVHCLSTTDTPK